MRILQDLAELLPPRDTALTVGVFDGVHLGHRYLIKRLVSHSKRRGLLSGVLTFLNHPTTVLCKNATVRYIYPAHERVRLLRETGADLIIPVNFDEELSNLRFDEFAQLLRDQLQMRALVVGPDFVMGRAREGDTTALANLGKQMGFEVEVVDPLLLSNIPVNSTTIRQALSHGLVEQAEKLLGRLYQIEGIVVRGRERGRHLGFPTANLATEEPQIIPSDGIYAVWALVDGQRLPAATSIGLRPTFGEKDRTIETYILDFDRNLYDHKLGLQFVRRIRDELWFESAAELKAQMGKDIETVRVTLRATGAASP